MPVTVIDREGKKRQGKVLQVLGFMGLERIEVEEAQAGDIVAISGIQELTISDTLCHPETPEALPALTVDEPTISMTFQVNNSPFAGNKDLSGGKFLTSRQLKERLERETVHNVALKVEQLEDADKFLVSGRGELHLSVLIENMRREGYELAVGRPRVVKKVINGVECEPYEQLTVDVDVYRLRFDPGQVGGENVTVRFPVQVDRHQPRSWTSLQKARCEAVKFAERIGGRCHRESIPSRYGGVGRIRLCPC